MGTCHYRLLRGARGTLIRSKSKVSSGRLTRYYTIGFYDIETGRDEYASFNQKQLLSDTDSLPDVDTSVIFDALRMMDTSVLCDGIRHTWMAENVRVAPHCFTYSTQGTHDIITNFLKCPPNYNATRCAVRRQPCRRRTLHVTRLVLGLVRRMPPVISKIHFAAVCTSEECTHFCMHPALQPECMH